MTEHGWWVAGAHGIDDRRRGEGGSVDAVVVCNGLRERLHLGERRHASQRLLLLVEVLDFGTLRHEVGFLHKVGTGRRGLGLGLGRRGGLWEVVGGGYGNVVWQHRTREGDSVGGWRQG